VSDGLLRITRAFHFAAEKHIGQRRKGASQEPYINHLAEVAELVAGATDGSDGNIVIAALLHDTIEDTVEWPNGIPSLEAEIRAAFGDDVLDLVWELTDDKNLEKEVRKQHQIDHSPAKSHRARIIKIADKISNLRALKRSPPANWPWDRRRKYLEWSRAVVAGLRGTSALLEAEFDVAAADLDDTLGAEVGRGAAAH
jgi:(p)ppGpp synthase/HD superfamily hydrolase